MAVSSQANALQLLDSGKHRKKRPRCCSAKDVLHCIDYSNA